MTELALQIHKVLSAYARNGLGQLGIDFEKKKFNPNLTTKQMWRQNF